jgi:hypothetical protein
MTLAGLATRRPVQAGPAPFGGRVRSRAAGVVSPSAVSLAPFATRAAPATYS